jgi:phosphoribosylglycinamide formyltransferase-1
MARLAVFASGRGSNFVAIADAVRAAGRHGIEFLLCDVEGAPVLERARERGIPTVPVSYAGLAREAVEKKMVRHLERRCVDVVALAGFMKLLTPYFINGFKGPVVNLHPSLLPKYPGTHGIEESWRSADAELGISVIRIDEGVDTGPVLLQKSFTRTGGESLAEVEERIHALEHEWFPKVVLGLLDEADAQAGRGPRGGRP